jgi:sugar (pentulose or hexulose) kinase
MANSEPLIMTFDYGTQSVRASIFDKRGNMLAMEKEVYAPAYFSPKPGWAEQDPDYYFRCLCACTKRLAARHPELVARVKGITQTCFRDSAVLLDADNQVVRPMVLWLDQRFAKCEKPLNFKTRLIFKLVGMTDVINMNRKRTIANWLIENEPENWARVSKYLHASTYFIYKLTGLMKNSAADHVGHYPLDYKNRCWYKDPEHHIQGQIFSVKKSMLCELVPEGDPIGPISAEGAEATGLPKGMIIYACGSDKSCETLGTGVIDTSMASISLGTAATIETTSKKWIQPVPLFPAYPACLPDYYNLDIQIYRGYWMINWFLKEFAAQRINDVVVDDIDVNDYNADLDKVPAGSGGLILQPYWGPGLQRPLVKGAIVGFTDTTTKECFYRAIIEGIDYALREGMEGFEKQIGHTFTSLRISGGGSKSDQICQITADIMGLPVSRVQTNETSSLGAAIAGFLAIKEFHDPYEAVTNMVHEADVFTPDYKTHEIYNKLYKEGYEKLYPSLRSTYESLCAFTKY